LQGEVFPALIIEDWFLDMRDAICAYLAEQPVPEEIPQDGTPFCGWLQTWVGTAEKIGQIEAADAVAGIGEELILSKKYLAWIRIVLLTESRVILLEPDSQASDGAARWLVLNIQCMVDEIGVGAWEVFSDMDLIVIHKTLALCSALFQGYERNRQVQYSIWLDENATLSLALVTSALVSRRLITNYSRGGLRSYKPSDFDV
jgi:hypothetical protein